MLKATTVSRFLKWITLAHYRASQLKRETITCFFLFSFFWHLESSCFQNLATDILLGKKYRQFSGEESSVGVAGKNRINNVSSHGKINELSLV